MRLETAEEFMRVPTGPGEEPLGEYETKLGLDKPVLGELADEQAFRELIESLVRVRSEGQARKSPRFLTPAALTGLNNFEFHGSLFVETTDPGAICGAAPGYEIYPRGDGGRLYGISIVDFSENGIQIQFKCNNPLELFNSRLFLKIEDARVQVTFKWYIQRQPVCRGGLFFSERTKSGRKLAGVISKLGTSLVEYLIRGFQTEEVPFSAQAGVYAYLAIFYSLRLLLLESISALKELENGAEPGDWSPDIGHMHTKFNGDSAERSSMSDRLMDIFMKPYLDFGCGLFGMAEDVVFPEQDVRATLLNSILYAEKDCCGSTEFLPSIARLYRAFHTLKLLLQGVLEAEEFDNQFKYYNSTIRGINLLAKRP